MKKFSIIALIIITAITIGCDDKISSLEELNLAPTTDYYTISKGLWLTGSSNILIKDSAKFYNNENKLPYSVSIRFKDKNKNFGYVNLTSSQSYNDFYVNDKQYLNNFKVELDSFSFSYKNQNDITKKFRMTVADTWDKTNTIDFDLTFFDNLPPTAAFNLNVISANEYEFNATSSLDQDKKWGGYIRQYEYVINNSFVITTTNNKIRHVFTSGTHIIKLRVKDSDNVWSSYTQNTVTIP